MKSNTAIPAIARQETKPAVSVRAAFERIRGSDQMQAYKQLFADIENGARATCRDGLAEEVLRTTVLHALTGISGLKRRIAEIEEEKAGSRFAAQNPRTDKAGLWARLQEAEKRKAGLWRQNSAAEKAKAELWTRLQGKEKECRRLAGLVKHHPAAGH